MEVALIASAAATGFGLIQEGQIARAQGKAERQVADFNARQMEIEAQSRMESARLEEQRLARQRRAALGQAKAAYGKSGVAIEEGSPIEVLADMAYQFDIDRNLTLRSGMLERSHLRSQAALQRWQGQWAEKRGKQARTASFIQAGGSLLQAGSTLGGGLGTSSVSGDWAGMNTSPGMGRTPTPYGSFFA